MRKGFALIELMTVVFILGVFAAFFTPKYAISLKRAREAQCLATRQNVKKAEMVYGYDHDGAFAEDLSVLKANNYLDRMPKCSEGGTYVWVSTNPPVLACSVHYWPFTSASTAAVTSPVAGNPLPPVPAYSFASDFDSMSGLYGNVGQWAAADGLLYNIGSSTHKIFFQTNESASSLKNYSVNLTASSSGPYGVYYRSDGKSSTNGYLFYYTSLGFRVYSSKNGSLSLLKSVSLPKGFSPYGQTHNVEITVNGSNHSVRVDGKEYMNFNNSLFTSGTAGLYTASSSQGTKFDAVSITKI